MVTTHIGLAAYGRTAMHGPKFNGDTVDVYAGTKSATINTIVP